MPTDMAYDKKLRIQVIKYKESAPSGAASGLISASIGSGVMAAVRLDFPAVPRLEVGDANPRCLWRRRFFRLRTAAERRDKVRQLIIS